MMDFEFYDDVQAKVEWEGLDYYVESYGNPDHFNGDPELRAAFVAARESLSRFVGLLETRIEQTSTEELHG